MKHCPKCGGLLYEIISADSQTGEGCRSRSCILCGNCIDETILENRTLTKRQYWKARIEQEKNLSASQSGKALPNISGPSLKSPIRERPNFRAKGISLASCGEGRILSPY
jgi:hypothetical protein